MRGVLRGGEIGWDSFGGGAIEEREKVSVEEEALDVGSLPLDT